MMSPSTLGVASPETAITGHGKAMREPLMRTSLEELARRFDEVARPFNVRKLITSGSLAPY
jgi:hypothetical protein